MHNSYQTSNLTWPQQSSQNKLDMHNCIPLVTLISITKINMKWIDFEHQYNKERCVVSRDRESQAVQWRYKSWLYLLHVVRLQSGKKEREDRRAHNIYIEIHIHVHVETKPPTVVPCVDYVTQCMCVCGHHRCHHLFIKATPAPLYSNKHKLVRFYKCWRNWGWDLSVWPQSFGLLAGRVSIPQLNNLSHQFLHINWKDKQGGKYYSKNNTFGPCWKLSDRHIEQTLTESWCNSDCFDDWLSPPGLRKRHAPHVFPGLRHSLSPCRIFIEV